MDKRGIEPVLWVIIEAVVITLAITMVFVYISRVKEDRLFEQKYLARDTSLLLSTVASVPGNVRYTYSHSGHDISQYTFAFENTKKINDVARELSQQNLARVYKTDKPGEKQLSADFPFYYDTNLALNAQTIMGEKHFTFAKNAEVLTVNKEITLDLKVRCMPAEHFRIDLLSIVDETGFGIDQMIISDTSRSMNVGQMSRNGILDQTQAVVILSKGDLTVGYAQQNTGQLLACLVGNELKTGSGPSSLASKKNTKGVSLVILVPDKDKAPAVARAIQEGVKAYNAQAR